MNENITLREALQEAFSFVKSYGVDSDGVKWLLKEQLDYNDTQMLVNYDQVLTEEERETFQKNVKKYADGQPPQYIIGFEWFYNRKFSVNPNVLIPRPETEELIEFYLNFTDDSPKRILDMGTGSGAIAITVKLERPANEVLAADLSENALITAQKNAKNLGADVHFVQSDLFNNLSGEKFDVILSNPPYVSINEWDEVDDSVKIHEPRMALVAENDGLAIYQRMADAMPAYLNENGVSFMEIGYRQGNAVKDIFQSVFPDKTVTILKDMSGHDRVMYLK